MARRRKRARSERIILLHEAADHFRCMAFRRKLGCSETEGDRALLAAIEAELSEDELVRVRQDADGGEPLRRLTSEEYERLSESCFFTTKASVHSDAGGWRKVERVTSLDDCRKAKELGSTR
jgi:hypothetical protein